MPIISGGGGSGGAAVLQTWLSSASNITINAGVFTAVTFTAITPGGGPGYANGPDELGLAPQLPNNYPLLDPGTYQVFGHFTCGDAAVAAAAAGSGILFQPRAVVASAITDDGNTVTLPCPAATGARTIGYTSFIITEQDVIDGDNGLIVSVGNYSDQNLASIFVTAVVVKQA